MTLSSRIALLSSYLHVLDKICWTCKNHAAASSYEQVSLFLVFLWCLLLCSFTILSLGPVFKSGSAHRIVWPLRNNTGGTLVHHATWHTSNGTLFTLLIFEEQGNIGNNVCWWTLAGCCVYHTEWQGQRWHELFCYPCVYAMMVLVEYY